MKIHILTVGKPNLAFARAGWQEYFERLKHHHSLRVTHIADKYAYDSAYLLNACGNAYKIALAIEGTQFASPELAGFLEKRSQAGQELCLLVGGPKGLPQGVLDKADFIWSLSRLTFPHDLAMVVLLESLYRAGTITAGHPYHK